MRRAVLIITALAVAGVVIVTMMSWIGGGASPTPSAAAGVPDVSALPVQTEPASRSEFSHSTPSALLTIAPMADYDVSALVVGSRRYSSGWTGDLAPIDLALAWGPLAHPDKIKHVKFKQGNRWYYYEWDSSASLTVGDIAEFSANTHTIPANANVRAALRRIRRGDRVRLTGFLVYVSGKYEGGDVWWKSSLSRQDTGNNSCELLFVERVQIEGDVYE